MKIRHSHSQFERKCEVCGKSTGGSKIYEQEGISIRIYVCGREKSDCHRKVMVKARASAIVRTLQEEIKKTKFAEVHS